MPSQFSRSGPPAAPPRPAALRRAGQRFGYGAASVLPPLDEQARTRPRPPPLPGEHPDGEAGHPQEPGADPAAGPRRMGKYLVSPLIKVLEDGWFASSVSIRSGSGRATTNRIFRLGRLFRCPMEAASSAYAEGLRWIGASPRSPAA